MLFPFHDDNPTVRTPVVTCAIIVINVIVFVWASRLPPLQSQVLHYQRGFVPARIAQLSNPEPIFVPIEGPDRHPFFRHPAAVRSLKLDPQPKQILLSLLTCMFMHGSWWHLIGNMWFLWIFGNNVEDRLGPVLYLAIYLAGGLLASGSHWLADPSSPIPVIGASGAVATVLGAYAITWPWARVHTLVFLLIFITIIDLPALLVLGVWFVGQLLAGRQSLIAGAHGGVAWWAHVGGFVAGLLLMPLLSAAVGAPPRPKLVRQSDSNKLDY